MINLDFSASKVAIIGDVMLDRYLVGTSTRMSPEAPVPVLENYKTEDRLGGAANVACNIIALGAKAFLFGVCGKDESGKKLRSLIASLQIIDYLIEDVDRRTTLKTRVMKEDVHLLRVDQEDLHEIQKNQADQIIERLLNLHLAEALDCIILQDYNKGLLSPYLIKEILIFAKKHSIATSVDPKFKNISSYRGCTLFKPNLKEVEGIIGRKVQSKQDIREANKLLRTQVNPELLVITLGDEGIYLSSSTSEVIVPALPLNTVDVCGAGDGVISFLSLNLDNSSDLQTLGEASNAVGRIICSQPGVAPISLELLKAYLADNNNG